MLLSPLTQMRKNERAIPCRRVFAEPRLRRVGGWWYGTGRFIRCHGTWSTREAAVKVRNAMMPTIAAARHGLHSPGSPLCTGWPDVRIEPHAGANFPGSPPR